MGLHAPSYRSLARAFDFLKDRGEMEKFQGLCSFLATGGRD